jgi:hypothetical protein
MFVSLRRSPYAVTGSKLPTAVGTTPAPQTLLSLLQFVDATSRSWVKEEVAKQTLLPDIPIHKHCCRYSTHRQGK